jgi:GNAT superfamily N-acetyltransferase
MAATTLPGFEIRDARPDDVPLILSFIRQLAEFEALCHEVVATEADLRQTLFGPAKFAEVIIGTHHGEPVCFALFFHNYSTFLGRPGLYLEDLFVQPAMRSHGFGKVMLTYLAHLARARGLRSIRVVRARLESTGPQVL